MDDFDSIFDPPSDTDTDLANASAMLDKIAADAGVDLNKLSEETIAELLGDLMPTAPHTDMTPTKEAQMTTQSPTVADVALELNKIASADGIDMTKVSRAEYAEAFDSLAARMSDPSYSQTKVAAEEEQAKLAEAYNQGARMADGFLDRLKQAEEEKDEEEKDEKKKEKAKEASSAGSALAVTRKGAKGTLDRAASTARYHGERIIEAVKNHGAKHKDKYTHGAAGAAGAAAGGGVGYAAGSRKKEAAEEADEIATKIAAHILSEAGFDPETGEKTAGEPDTDGMLLTALAFQKIAEAGYFGPTE